MKSKGPTPAPAAGEVHGPGKMDAERQIGEEKFGVGGFFFAAVLHIPGNRNALETSLNNSITDMNHLIFPYRLNSTSPSPLFHSRSPYLNTPVLPQ